ncbi:MAG: transposase [Pirellulales bacterium]|nr:transposase [Pirellulales bacterium]
MGTLTGRWVPHDTRDEVVDYVRRWKTRTKIPAARLVTWLGLGASKFASWWQRYGKVNGHNGPVPRDPWLLPSKREAIVVYHAAHPGKGYRRLTYMMMDADVVAANPTSVWRVLKSAGCLDRGNRAESRKNQGFSQPLRPHEHWRVDISHVNSGMTPVRTSPYYPRSNGKIERWHKTLKGDCLRPGTPLSLEDARRLVTRFVARYNHVRLHGALGYVTPADRLAGRHEAIFAQRDRKLDRARAERARRRETPRADATKRESQDAATNRTEERLAGESRGAAMSALRSA